MAAITQDDRFTEMAEMEGGKPENMCEVLDRAEARGEARGKAIGEARGKAIGEASGIEKTRIESIKNVMESLKMTAQQAMDVLKIPVAERDKYASKL